MKKETMTFIECMYLVDFLIDQNMIRTTPAGNVIVYRDAPNEGWYEIDKKAAAEDIFERPESQAIILANIKKRNLTKEWSAVKGKAISLLSEKDNLIAIRVSDIVKEVYEKEHNRLINDKENSESLMRVYCLDTLLQADGLKDYIIAAEFCFNHQFNPIDIGCDYGYQSEIFLQYCIGYTGVERLHVKKTWNENSCRYIHANYPVHLDTTDKDIAISRFCLGWDCFKYSENEFEKQADQLAADFKQVLIDCQENFANLLKQRYKHVERIKSTWYYFTNQDEGSIKN